MHRLEDLLSAFARLPGQGDPAPWTWTFQGGAHQRSAVFASLVHGDEVGSLPGLVAVATALAEGRLRYGGRVSFVLGNPEAARAGQRLLEADLNRVFLDAAPESAERRRARELTPLLEGCELFVDLHQTARPTRSAFYTLPWTPRWDAWCRALAAAPLWVTRAPGQAFATGRRCADEFVRDRGAVGITVELSALGFDPDTDARVERTLRRALALLDASAADPSALEREALAAPPLRYLQRVATLPFRGPEDRLRPGLVNFQAVRAGERLSDVGAPTLLAPIDGLLMFPKYPDRVDGKAIAPLPDDIVQLASDLPDHPSVLFGGG